MKTARKKQLQQAGWKIGTAQELLGLSQEEAALIDMKLALAESLKKRRISERLTQGALAKRLKSSQSRVAKMEAADASVSMELLVRSLLVLGMSRKEVGGIIGSMSPVSAA